MGASSAKDRRQLAHTTGKPSLMACHGKTRKAADTRAGHIVFSPSADARLTSVSTVPLAYCLPETSWVADGYKKARGTFAVDGRV